MKRYYNILAKINCTLSLLSLSFTAPIFTNSVVAQERKLVYDIVKNGNIIGKINFIELIQGQKKFISFSAEANTTFILSFCDHSSETAAYDNGVMMYSSFYQNQSGSDKVNKKTIASGECYKLMADEVLQSITCNPIRYNTLLLYINMPQSISKVYSDNFQKYLEIKKVGDNKYRLTLPDGNYNYYTYKDGICSKVEIEHTFFKVQFILKDEL
jgi:hypothetical protein